MQLGLLQLTFAPLLDVDGQPSWENDETTRNRIVNEEYKIWKKNSIFLYDVLYTSVSSHTHTACVPKLTCRNQTSTGLAVADGAMAARCPGVGSLFLFSLVDKLTMSTASPAATTRHIVSSLAPTPPKARPTTSKSPTSTSPTAFPSLAPPSKRSSPKSRPRAPNCP